MPAFSQRSLIKLESCDFRLEGLFHDVILTYDCTIIEGYRSEERQQQLYEEGKSKVIRSKHNEEPSMAVDVAPYVQGRGIPWPVYGSDDYFKSVAQWYHFAGYVTRVAEQRNVKIRWGGSWDRDYDVMDQNWNDLPHWELV